MNKAQEYDFMGFLSWLFGSSTLFDSPPDATPSLVVRSFAGNVFRFHAREHIHGSDVWKMFLDGPWKWKTQERFAGSDFNCGHFFSLTPEGAQSEMAFYKIATDRPLVEVKVALNSVLDLTDLRCLRHVMSIHDAAIRNYATVHHEFILAFLTDERAGGNDLTDAIGHWASGEGYQGVLFYSARCLPPELRRAIRLGNDYAWEMNASAGHSSEVGCAELQRDLSLQNLVVFSGATLAGTISEFRIDQGPWVANSHYGLSLENLDDVLREHNVEYDSRYQDNCRPIVVRDSTSVDHTIPKSGRSR